MYTLKLGRILKNTLWCFMYPSCFNPHKIWGNRMIQPLDPTIRFIKLWWSWWKINPGLSILVFLLHRASLTRSKPNQEIDFLFVATWEQVVISLNGQLDNSNTTFSASYMICNFTYFVSSESWENRIIRFE